MYIQTINDTDTTLGTTINQSIIEKVAHDILKIPQLIN